MHRATIEDKRKFVHPAQVKFLKQILRYNQQPHIFLLTKMNVNFKLDKHM